MDYINQLVQEQQAVALFFGLTIVCLFLLAFIRLTKWAKKVPKGAYLFLALFPLISLFPIPPPAFESLDKAKREEVKRKEDSGNDNNES